jgi:outer membrane protein OmpA-like peptidoglycan-associated protein
MRSGSQRIWVPAVLALLVTSSGCASRGYVRNQVNETSETLQARIADNTEDIERTQQGLASLEVETSQQSEEIIRTQGMIEAARTEMIAEVDEVRTMTVNAGTLAGAADERSRDVARMLADRSRLQITDTWEIYFPFSNSTIQPEHAEALQAAGEKLRSDPDTILVLEGRTDSTGDTEFNRTLGQARVDAAKGYLVLELGVPVHRIHGFSYGEARPDYDNEILDERQKNRSVKLVVLGPGRDTVAAALPE